MSIMAGIPRHFVLTPETLQIGHDLGRTLWTDAVREQGFGMAADSGFDLLPLVAVVSYSPAIGTDRQKTP
jgi:hypothetical protein